MTISMTDRYVLPHVTTVWIAAFAGMTKYKFLKYPEDAGRWQDPYGSTLAGVHLAQKGIDIHSRQIRW